MPSKMIILSLPALPCDIIAAVTARWLTPISLLLHMHVQERQDLGGTARDDILATKRIVEAMMAKNHSIYGVERISYDREAAKSMHRKELSAVVLQVSP